MMARDCKRSLPDENFEGSITGAAKFLGTKED